MQTNGTVTAAWIAAPFPTAGEWNHLAYAADTTTVSDNVRSYKNGGAPSTTSRTFPGAMLSNGRDLVLGNLGKTAGNSFNGKIDEVRISKCVRSADWVKVTHDTIDMANFATYAVGGSAQPSGADFANIKLNASTDKANPIYYAVGETIRFDFRLDGVETLSVALHDRLPLCVVWERTGDDGLTAKGRTPFRLSRAAPLQPVSLFPASCASRRISPVPTAGRSPI